MRRLRIQYSIFIILAFLSIMSVGFASWVTTTDSPISSIEGSIQVDDVIESNEYITNVSPTKLKFYKTGFVTNEGSISQTGTMSIELTIDIKKCKETFKDATSLNLYFTTTYSDNSFNFFNDPTNLPVTIKVSDDSLISNDIAVNGNECISKIEIKDLAQDTKTITISFTITNNLDSFATIYNSLKNSKFTYSAKITGNGE